MSVIVQDVRITLHYDFQKIMLAFLKRKWSVYLIENYELCIYILPKLNAKVIPLSL